MERLCEEKHKAIDKSLEVHDRRLDNHGGRIDELEQGQREFRTEIKNLCKDIQKFNICFKMVYRIINRELRCFSFFMQYNKLYFRRIL